jgi:hypothetical protein
LHRREHSWYVLLRSHITSTNIPIAQKWLRFGVLIGTIATALLNFVSPNDVKGLVAASLFTFAALLAIAYSGVIFVIRSRKLRKRRANGLYYDPYGPTVLCFVLGVALLTNIILRVVDL